MLRIPRDFEFELDFLRARESGDVSVAWLRDRMAAAHAAWFGEALVSDGGDSLSWAYNHIMMEPNLRLYNFPYSFGYLLSRRIADAFYEQGPEFTSTYIGFLRASGSMTAEDAVAATLGFDVASELIGPTAATPSAGRSLCSPASSTEAAVSGAARI